MGFELSTDQLEEVVSVILDTIPDHIADKVENLAVLVRDEPDEEDLAMANVDEAGMALYVPGGTKAFPTLPATYLGHAPERPDRIVVYRLAVQRECEDLDQVRVDLRERILHEFGRYFGVGDDGN